MVVRRKRDHLIQMMQGFELYLIGLECEFDSVAMFSVRKAE